MSWHLNKGDKQKSIIYTKIEMAQCESIERFPICIFQQKKKKERIVAVIISLNSRH